MDKFVSWRQRLDGSYKVRLVARGFEQTVSSDADFFAGMPKLTTLRGLLTKAALHGNPVAFGDCHSAFHQSPMPLNQNQCMWSQHRKHSWTLPRYGFARKLFLDSRFLLRPGVFTAHRNQRHELQPVDIRSFDVREETCTKI